MDENSKEEYYQIIIQLVINNDENEKEINILCDKDALNENNKKNENYYKENNINPPKEFNYFNKDNTILYLNEDEIDFNYKINFNKKGTNKIIIKSNVKLNSLSSMFYNCCDINIIKFLKINTNDAIDMRDMFYNCYNLVELDLSLLTQKM